MERLLPVAGSLHCFTGDSSENNLNVFVAFDVFQKRLREWAVAPARAVRRHRAGGCRIDNEQVGGHVLYHV